MISRSLAAAALATLLAAPALADDRHGGYRPDRYRDQPYGQRHYDRGHDRGWQHAPPSAYRHNSGYRAGYEAGWRDAARHFRYSYRPGRWYRDGRGYWYFGFEYRG